MGRAVLIAITLFTLMLQSSIVFGSSGQVLQVVDGDTFMMEVAGVGGQETIEVNLRCSDAPIISAPFGQESRQHLASLLKGAEIHFKIQAYCGSETCVEVLAYIPDPLNPKINYINTQMIAAGMARNDSCRGVFNEVEAQAKAEKKGIWSTSKKIVFTEAVKVAKPDSTKTTKQPTISALNPKAAPALIEVDRAERTVTLKSRSMSLSKAIKAIDTVSTLPVSLYLIEEQFVAVSLEKVAWYVALQHLVEKTSLKQVNMNGKIDLYDQLFYYKHIAPYLKLSDNKGVYIKAGSGTKSPIVDDGVTRYVFINDFENSAAEARQQADDQSGFVQVHQGAQPAPVSNYGRFEVSSDKEQPATVATAASEVVKPPADLPALKPYSGQKSIAEQNVAAVAAPAVAPVQAAVAPVATAVVKNAEPQETVTKTTAIAKEQGEKSAEPVKSGTTDTLPADKTTDSEQVLNIELTMTELVVLLIVVVVVVFGSIFLSRSAANRAAKAEKSIDPTTLGQKVAAVETTPEPVVDKAYEQEVFDDIEHVDTAADSEKAVDDIFEDGDDQPVEPSTEDSVDAPVEAEVAAEEEAEPETEDTAPEEVAVAAESVEEADQEEDTAEADAVDVAADEAAEPEELTASADVVEDEPPAETVIPAATEETKAKPSRPVLKKSKKTTTDEGNYAVTLEDYDRLMNPPKREPRTDCLFEMTCSLDGQTMTGIGLDISSGGIFIDSKDHFAVGKVLDLTFKLREEDEETIRCRGAVTWVNARPDPIKPNYPNGFGVHFIDVDAATAQLISDFIKPDTVEPADEAEVDL